MPVSIELVPDEGIVESGATSKVHAWFASSRRKCSRVFMQGARGRSQCAPCPTASLAPTKGQKSTTISLFRAGGSAGTWSILIVHFGINDSLAVTGGWKGWRVERPEICVWNRRPSLNAKVFPRGLGSGASSWLLGR